MCSEEIKTCPPRNVRAHTLRPERERRRGRQIGEIVVEVVASPSKLPRPKDATGFGGLCSAKCARGQREGGRGRGRRTRRTRGGSGGGRAKGRGKNPPEEFNAWMKPCHEEDDGTCMRQRVYVHASASARTQPCVRARRKVNKFSLFSIPILYLESRWCPSLALFFSSSDFPSVFLSSPTHSTLPSTSRRFLRYTCLGGRF